MSGLDPASPGDPSHRLDRLPDPARFVIGTFTRLPVPPPRVLDRRTAGRGLLWAPLVGMVLGLVGGLPLLLMGADLPARLLAATLVAGLAAWLTRGLHWDGLADLADGLGSGAPPARARDIMARSDIGPFGVIVVVFVLLIQILSLAQLPADRHAYAAWVLAMAGGRLAVVVACGPWARAARPGGLGAAVAGCVSVPGILIATVTTLAVGGLATAWSAMPWVFALWAPLAAVGTAGAVGVLARRRIEGVTGDVLGAIVELTTAVTLLGAALR